MKRTRHTSSRCHLTRLLAMTLALTTLQFGAIDSLGRPNREGQEKSEPVRKPSQSKSNSHNTARSKPPSPPRSQSSSSSSSSRSSSSKQTPRPKTPPPQRPSSHQRSAPPSANRSQPPPQRPQTVTIKRPSKSQTVAPRPTVQTNTSKSANRSSSQPTYRNTSKTQNPRPSQSRVYSTNQNRSQEIREANNNRAVSNSNPRNENRVNNSSALAAILRNKSERNESARSHDQHNDHNHATARPPSQRPQNGPSKPNRSDYDRDRDEARLIYDARREGVARAANVRQDLSRRRMIETLDSEKQERLNAGKRDDHRHGGHDDHRDHGRNPGRGHDHHRPVFDRDHHHGAHCGHHFHNGRWYDFPSSHRHYHGCGHKLVSGIWISVTIGHVHGRGCGHFYENGIWLSHTGYRHHHRPGCGHFFYDGYWHNTACYHIHGPGCGHHYYNGRWNDFPDMHVHTDYCGHLYDGANWLIVDSDQHIHGYACGHYRFNDGWFTYPRNFYTMNREDSLFFFVDLGDYQERDFPEWAYREWVKRGRAIDIFRSTDATAKAYAAFAEGRYYDSLVRFNIAIQNDRDNGLLYLGRAQAQIAIKDYRAAYDDLMAGLSRFPEWADTRINLSEIYSDSTDLQEHSELLENWVARYPRDYKAHFVLGYFYFFHQDFEAAKNELLYVLSWDENHEPAQLLMDRIFAYEAEYEVITREEGLEEDPIEVTRE